MQPFIVVLIFFAVCLAHGIHRAMQDVREEEFNQRALRESIPKMIDLSSEVFVDIAKCANESIKRFSIIFYSKGGMARDAKEMHGYLSKDCVS